MRKGRTSFSTSGIKAIAAKVAAIVTKPIIWIDLRPIRSIIAAATRYPGAAATAKTASCMRVWLKMLLSVQKRHHHADDEQIVGVSEEAHAGNEHDLPMQPAEFRLIHPFEDLCAGRKRRGHHFTLRLVLRFALACSPDRTTGGGSRLDPHGRLKGAPGTDDQLTARRPAFERLPYPRRRWAGPTSW